MVDRIAAVVATRRIAEVPIGVVQEAGIMIFVGVMSLFGKGGLS